MEKYQDEDIKIHMNDDDDKLHVNENAKSILRKTELMFLNNGWNEKNEQIIISIGENAASYKWMHEKSASEHKFIYKCTNMLLIILSTTLSADTIFSSSNNEIFNIIKRVFIYLVAIISVLQNFFRSEEVSASHLNAAGQFFNLYHDIQQQMCMFRRDRKKANYYVADCLKQYDSLVIESPDISSRILKMFIKTFNNTDTSLPDIVDKIQKIEIIKEDNEYQSGFSIKNKDLKLPNSASTCTAKKCNELSSIHNAYQIQGDISDKELNSMNLIELKELKKKFLDEKSNYEYTRYLQHNNDYE
jgi:hypothetical protein